MPPTVALVAPTARRARAATQRLEREHGKGRFRPYSLEGFLAAADAPAEIVLCPTGRRLSEDVAFLRAARDRLLWPAPPGDLSDAIAGLRPRDAPASAGTARGGPILRALLLEGEVTAARAGAALESGAPRDWIVEDCRRVRLSPARLAELRRRGVRWLALSPVVLLAVAASPALAGARARWKRLLRKRIPIWITPAGSE